ncbi:iron-sulfur cluster assembly protein IscA [Neptuniibacter marinus]|uniref:iron-sulfur cluster assembly protein IscA n=1 Tax=Neptuniibacter marinus TaxID=1806670 RepID=UPI0008344904|nr:iron-sulfur cluster assembly protein IscA [Neptuniibacter marinus]
MAITMTDAAAEHVARYIEKRGQGAGVRLGVRTSGCSGMAYVLEFVDEVQDEDEVFDGPQDVRIVIDPKSLLYLDGTELDFVKEGLNEGFKFNNPNVSSECGCGESFNV